MKFNDHRDWVRWAELLTFVLGFPASTAEDGVAKMKRHTWIKGSSGMFR